MADYRTAPQRTHREPEFSIRAKVTRWGLIALVVFGLITLWLGVFNTAQYERDIITRYNAFHRVAQPGLNFKAPWVDGAETVDMRQDTVKFDNMEAYSSDQQIAKLDVSVTFKPRESKLQYMYNEYRTINNVVDKVLRRYVPADVKIVFGDYTAESAIKDRDRLTIDVKDKLITHLGEDPVIEILSVNVEDIEYSKAYNESVEQRMMAQVDVLKIRQNWEKEKVTADIIKTQADAAAYKIKAQGDAEALAIDAVGKALAANPSYVDKMIAERYKGDVPQTFTMIPGASAPLVQIPSFRKN